MGDGIFGGRIPLEVYCFTTTTKWKDYENIQSDIFEHFFAILPENSDSGYTRNRAVEISEHY